MKNNAIIVFLFLLLLLFLILILGPLWKKDWKREYIKTHGASGIVERGGSRQRGRMPYECVKYAYL